MRLTTSCCPAHSTLDRRRLMTCLAGAGAATLLPGAKAEPQAATVPNPRRLDLHHHFGSPRWIKRLGEVKRQGWDGFQNYSPEKAIDGMNKGGIETAFLSCTEPGVWYGDDFNIERAEAISMARDLNDFGARLVTDHKGRFGLFAVLPLPDIDASLKEIEYAFDVLKADGVGLLTSYGDMWLGDKRLEPVMDELNRRGAIVYVHPTDAPCCRNLGGMNVAIMEWFADTARSINSLVSRRPGSPRDQPDELAVPASRYSNIKFIWSHGGGMLIGSTRIVRSPSEADLAGTPAPHTPLAHVRRYYYDTAAVSNSIIMQGLKKLLGGSSHIVFGTDYPWGDLATFAQVLPTIGFTPAELRGVDRENALAILPKYRTA